MDRETPCVGGVVGTTGNDQDTYYAGSGATVRLSTVSEKQAVRERLTPNAGGVVLALVGLPARGKSFISRKVQQFLLWQGTATRSFNVGMYRRDCTNPEQSGRSDFFDVRNRNAACKREAAAELALADALLFLDSGGQVAIYDATNSTSARRRRITEQVRAHMPVYSVVFVEVICDDAQVVEANMRNKVSNSPDFCGMPVKIALADIKLRIAKYEEVYETVQDTEGSFIKLFNLSSKVMANHCYGRVARSILPYLMGIHIGARPIWLVRAGKGESNPQSPGSDRLAKLSQVGMGFAATLAEFTRIEAERFWSSSHREPEAVHVYTSTMPRAVASVSCDSLRYEQTSALNPIDKGAVGAGWWDVECPGDLPPWDEVKRRHPELWEAWGKDPLRCRFPGGESYMDVVRRLEAFLIEVEQCTVPVLIVSHVTVLQLLVAYFQGKSVSEAWRLPFRKGVVFEATPTLGGGFQCREHVLSGDAMHGTRSPGDSDDCGGGAAAKRQRTL
jgi:6-phosphofructo-2-kinase/fructose-2,6-biphosphatase 1